MITFWWREAEICNRFCAHRHFERYYLVRPIYSYNWDILLTMLLLQMQTHRHTRPVVPYKIRVVAHAKRHPLRRQAASCGAVSCSIRNLPSHAAPASQRRPSQKCCCANKRIWILTTVLVVLIVVVVVFFFFCWCCGGDGGGEDGGGDIVQYCSRRCGLCIKRLCCVDELHESGLVHEWCSSGTRTSRSREEENAIALLGSSSSFS